MPNTEAVKKNLFLDKNQGQNRWLQFKKQIDRYHLTRNFDLGPKEHHSTTSNLSPWISHRTLLERNLWNDLKDLEASEGVEKWQDELIWRLYFRSYLFHHPEVWQDLRSQTFSNLDPVPSKIASFCSWVEELVSTGYLHNHARMWLASIWIFYEGLNWKQGALWMYTQLLDGDIASNTLGWRWVGGLHTRGKAYHASSGNIMKFTRGRFSNYDLPPRILDCLTESRLTPAAHMKLEVLPPKQLKLGLLLHPLDLSAQWPNSFQEPPGVLLPLHKARVALQDAGSRAMDLVETARTLYPNLQLERDSDPSQALAHVLAALAKKWQLDAWVTPFPGIGPFFDLFESYLSSSQNHELPLYFLTDPLDLFIFDIQESSYFGFRRKFRKHLSASILEAEVALTRWVHSQPSDP